MPSPRLARLAQLGQRSPLYFAIPYCGIVLLLDGLSEFFIHLQWTFLFSLLQIWIGIAFLLFLGLMALYRTEDTVSVGVLVAIAAIVSGIFGKLVVLVLTTGSVGGAVLLFMSALIPLFIGAAILIPISIALVWLARRIGPPGTPAVDDARHPPRVRLQRERP